MSAQWRDRKVLVTGASGFLGSSVAHELVQRGATVYGTARRPATGVQGVSWLQADLSDRVAMRHAVRAVRPDAVLHLAGRTGVSQDAGLVVPMLEANLVGTVLLLSEALDCGVARIVVTGSLEESREPDALSEPGASPYGISKWASVAYARMFHDLYRLPVAVVRPYMTYGPRQQASKLVPYVTLALIRGEAPRVSQPDRLVDWVYVEDVVDGILAAAGTPEAIGRVIDLGSGNLVSIGEVVQRIEEIVGGPATARFSPVSAPAGLPSRKADTATAQKCLGWTATTPLEAGLQKTVHWYRAKVERDTTV